MAVEYRVKGSPNPVISFPAALLRASAQPVTRCSNRRRSERRHAAVFPFPGSVMMNDGPICSMDAWQEPLLTVQHHCLAFAIPLRSVFAPVDLVAE